MGLSGKGRTHRRQGAEDVCRTHISNAAGAGVLRTKDV
jgi:hypothetical protein